jgi:ATP-dependent Clp protease ATP-binding subunit ClpB
MKRVIQQQLENPLAQLILSGYFMAGDTIKVDLDNNVLRFLKA